MAKVNRMKRRSFLPIAASAALAFGKQDSSNVPLARIAEEIGYQNYTAFSRAFRREFGVPPAAWRKSRLESTTVD